MIKQVPSLERVFAMVAFGLSCFGILLFLWLSFGGATPLKAEGYKVTVAFPEAVGLSQDADVRSAGITIGTVRKIEVEPESGRTRATLVLESRFAPLPSDARAILRRKTLLGETFVELTPGSRGAPKLADGGRLANSRVGRTTELDEVLQTFDPRTRRAFQLWQQEVGVAVEKRGENLNNALGNLPEFAENGSSLLGVLDREEAAVRGLVRDTGEVYSALTEDEGRLRDLVTNSHGVFRQTAEQREALAEAFQIFPTFLTESRVTLDRLKGFSRDTRPLIRDLTPVARELRPTVRSVRALAPDLERFFGRFDEQIRVSKRALPALRQVLDGTRPLFASLGPFLQEFNPIFQWLELYQHQVSDFLGFAASALADTTPSTPAGETGHYLRQLSVTGVESIAIHRDRLSSSRGNSYLPPIFTGEETTKRRVQPNFDCKPSGGEVEAQSGGTGTARVGCWVAPEILFKGKKLRQFPQVEAENYGR